ncbi:ATP-binding protein [Brevundimonas sp.]|uniref:ATP-binding protein n=1 Tax=Brevundimonas sp. TaxID=1871086 RepID=UPI0028A9FEA5|nr:ATP-binding protein [Brevundimonas sp.]
MTTLNALQTSPNLAAQHACVERLKADGFKFGLTVGDAFVRGIRDLGYKSNGNALAELVDNSAQAGADRVEVVFGYGGQKSEKKPNEIAIIDNGHGMEPDMIRLAVLWGGTHREGDRTGMGRYGYGLPSACVSMGKSFTVYSKTADGDLHAVTVDLKAIGDGEYTNSEGDIIIPSAQPATLPKFVQARIAEAFPDGWRSGAVIVIEKLDRLHWSTSGGLRENLLRFFGVAYHKLRADLSIYVDSDYVEPIDPLFLTPGYRFFDIDEDRAQALEPLTITVKDPKTREAVGEMVVRFAYMPPTFASIDKGRTAVGREVGASAKNANPRFAVMKDFHGIIFSRMGRMIDVVSRPPWTTFLNDDRYIKVEVEFPAVLDEEFGITTSKQQITVSERVWNILKENGVPKAIEQMRNRFREMRSERKEAAEALAQGQKRASEDAMEAARVNVRGPSAETKARQDQRGQERLIGLAGERARESGRTVEDETQQLLLELDGRGYRLEIETSPGAPFFRCDVLGGAKVLYLNRAHRFYQDVYDGPRSSMEVRAALEILLFAIGDSMLDATEENLRAYRVELPQWSMKLELALERLAENVAFQQEADQADLAG